MRSASSPRAVSMITGRSPRSRIQRQSASPSVPGSITSSTTSCGAARLDQRRAPSSPSPASSVVEAVAREVADDDVADDRLVVDDEDGRSSHAASCRCSSTHFAWWRSRPSPRRTVPMRDPAQRVPRRRVDQREVEMPDEQHERDVHQPVVEQDRAREAEAVSRSPSQSRSPETAKSSANAAVSAAFSFWPALKRPCGARRRRAASAGRRVEAVELARGRAQAAAVAEQRRSARARRPTRPPCQKWMSFTSGRRPTSLAEARDVEHEPGREQDEERGRVNPVERALRAREARVDVAAVTSVAIRAADPGVGVVAALLPVARARLRARASIRSTHLTFL